LRFPTTDARCPFCILRGLGFFALLDEDLLHLQAEVATKFRREQPQ